LVGVGAQERGVCSIVPAHDVVYILVVLLEAHELLFDEDSTSVVEVVSRQVGQVLLAFPHLRSVLLHCIFVLGVSSSNKDNK